VSKLILMLPRRIAIHLSIAAAVAAAIACNNPETAAAVDSAAVLTQSGGDIAFADSSARQNLCPTPSAMDSLRGLSDSTISFVRRNGYYHWCIPEYHDDQRFHDGNAASTDYGPGAHVFAWPRIAALTDHSQFDSAYVNVGIVDIDTLLPDADMPEPYKRLGLTGLHNCLYLMHHHPTGGIGRASFKGLMVTPTAGTCPIAPIESSGTPLDVAIETYSNTQSDYPPVARFVEGERGLSLVSVKCTDRWCVIGPKPLGNIPKMAHDNVASLKTNVRGNVKGWFDDQVLGVPDGTPKYKIHRKVRASLIPDPLLGSYKIANFIGPDYKVVGRAHFVDAPPAGSKYDTVFGFTKGTNTIGLRAEIVPGTPKPDTVWYSQVINASGGTKSKIMTHRTDHSAWLKSLPGTARFRFYDDDEDLWFMCDLGCCLINGHT